jgi:hypothetical protein
LICHVQRRDFVSAVTGVLPIAFAIPIVSAMAISTARLIGTGQPLAGFIGGGTNADALTLYHGFGLYHDPASGYLGSVYTPGVPMLVAVLDHVVLWSGWVPLICYAASFPIAALAGWLYYGDTHLSRARLWELLGAVGFAAMSWWLLSALENPSLYTGHVDHPAWFLAFAGLLVLPWAARGSTGAMVAVVILFSLAMWTKQSAVAAAIASILWLSLQGPAERLKALTLTLLLLAINGVVAAVLIVSTHGWAWRLLFEFGLHQPVAYGGRFIIHEFLRDHALVLIATAATWGVVFGGLRRSHQRVDDMPADIRAFGSLIALFVMVSALVAFQARRLAGGQDNEFIPVTWGLILLLALGFRGLRAHIGGQIVGAALIVALLVAGSFTALRQRLSAHGIRVATLHPVVSWPVPTPGLGPPGGNYSGHSYYDWTGTIFSTDTQGRPYPPATNVGETLAFGRSPNYFVLALLDRRFSALQLFPRALESGPLDDYASGDGRTERHFFWKLNRVISSRYMPAPDGPPGILIRTPGPEPDRWMRSCFAPLEIGRIRFGIGQGGGFWCRSRPGRLKLADTPSASSDVHTQSPVRGLTGRLELRFRGGAAAIIVGDYHRPAFELQLLQHARSGSVDVLASRDRQLLLRTVLRVAPPGSSALSLPIVFSRGPRATASGASKVIHVAMPAFAVPQRLSLSATRDSRAEFLLTGLRLS